MILFDGQLLPDERLGSVMKGLADYCIQTITSGEISVSEVIESCGTLSDCIRDGRYDEVLHIGKEQGRITKRQMEEAVRMLDRKNLEYKYKTELEGFINCRKDSELSGVQKECIPLGILVHIAAGNAEGLPFYSVVDGLLTGNINILKIPSTDDRVSLFMLQELVKMNPRLARYIIVLNISSANRNDMTALSKMADGIVVWGGDHAIRAVRKMADPGTRIISWGHKISFAYAAPDSLTDELERLAHHICATNQLLCSSCQGIFVDTDNMADVKEMGLRFLDILEKVGSNYPALSLKINGKIGLELYNEELENVDSGRTIFRGKGVSVTVADDQILEVSHMFRNCWVKPLPRAKIIKALKPYRGYLQTAGLLCYEKDRAYLEGLLIKAGVVRITKAGGMSGMTPGEAHDGEYALQRYCRIVEIEK